MSKNTSEPIWTLMGLLFQAHPWRGISPGKRCHEDYEARFGNIEGLLTAALRG